MTSNQKIKIRENLEFPPIHILKDDDHLDKLMEEINYFEQQNKSKGLEIHFIQHIHLNKILYKVISDLDKYQNDIISDYMKNRATGGYSFVVNKTEYHIVVTKNKY